jgi:thioredoxin 1
MPTNNVRRITAENFQDEVLESPVPVLVDFDTAWCPPCRVLAPILERFAVENEGRVRVGAVAADECPSLAARFAVKGYPTVIAFAGGKERARHLGATRKEKLLQMVEACRGDVPLVVETGEVAAG